MKRTILFACCLLLAACHRLPAVSTTPYANASVKNAGGDTILLGHCSVNQLDQPHYQAWFQKSYNSYTVDTAAVAALAPQLKDKTIEVFLGSWCGDSRREVPRLIKILQAAHFDTAHLRLVFVDYAPGTYKQSPAHEEAGKFIVRVPTIIVYGKKEIGRMVESPVQSLEKDLLNITTGSYTPHYQVVDYLRTHRTYTHRKMDSAALVRLAKTLTPMAGSVGELTTLGYVLFAQKNYTGGMNAYQLNALLYPDSPVVYDWLARGYATMGNKEKARACYQKELVLKPGDANAAKQLALLE